MAGISLGRGADVKGIGHNRLNSVFILSKSSQLVGDCNSDPGSIRFWSLENGKLNDVIQLDKNEFSSSIAVSPDESLIAVGTFTLKSREREGGSYGTTNRSIGCYSIKEKKWLWKVKVEGTSGDCAGCDFKVAFTSDNNKVLAAGIRYILTFDAKTGELSKKQEDPLDNYSASVHSKKMGKIFSPSAKYFVVWQEKPREGHEILSGLFINKRVTVWDMEKNERIAYWEKDKPICSATVTPDEKNIIIGSMDGYIRIWSLSEQKIIREWKSHWRSKYPDNKKDINAITSISPDSRYLATSGDGDKRFNVKIWDYATGNLVHEFSETAFSVEYCGDYPMVFSNDGKYFAFQNWGNLCLYDTQTWKEKWCVPSWPEDNGKMWRYEQRPGKGFSIR